MNDKKRFIAVVLFMGIISSIPVIQAVLELKDGERPHIMSLFTNPPTEQNLRTFESALEERSFIENALRPPMQYWQYVLCGDAGAKAVPGKDGWLFYTPAIDYLTGPSYADQRLLKPVSGAAKKDWDVLACIVGVRDQLAAQGIDLLVVPIPAKATVYPEKASSAYTTIVPELYAHARTLITNLEQAGVACIDLHTAYAQERSKDNDAVLPPLYLKRDTHWAARGLRIAAQLVAQRVRQYAWYDSSMAIGNYALHDTTIVRYGDIGAMTKIPHNQIVFPAESTVCYQVIDTVKGKRYRNSKKSPLLLLGDSFTRIYHSDPPKQAGFLAHIAYELQMPLTALYNNGGASTLVREQLAHKKRYLKHKKLVIWEFTERDIRLGIKGWKPVALK